MRWGTRLVRAGEERLRQFSMSTEVAKLTKILVTAKTNNNRAVVFRQQLISWERERRRIATALRSIKTGKRAGLADRWNAPNSKDPALSVEGEVKPD